MEQQQVLDEGANQPPRPEEVKKQSETQKFQNKQIEARLYVLKPQEQKNLKGGTATLVQQKKIAESDFKQKQIKQHRGGIINKQSSGDTDAMNGVGVEDLAFDDAIGSSIESEQWNLMAIGGSKGIFNGSTIKNVINVDFSEPQGSDIQLRLTDNNPNLQAISNAQDLASSIDSTPNNDQNDVHYSMQSKSPHPETLLRQQVHIEQSELIHVQQSQHKTIVQLNYSPQPGQDRLQNKNQQREPKIMSHGLLPQSQLSSNAQRLHQYSKLIHKSSIAGTKFTTLNSQLKVNPESISAPATTTIVSGQEIANKPQLLSNKKTPGITSSLIAKSSIISTSSMRKTQASPNHSSNLHHLQSKQAKTALKNHPNESEYQLTTTPFIYQGPTNHGAQSFHLQNSALKQSQMSITPGQVVQKSSFLANTNFKQSSNPSIAAGGKLSPRISQTNNGSYSILARQRSQNKLQSSASQPQMLIQHPMIIQSLQQTGLMMQSDDSSRSGGNNNNHLYPTINLLQVDQQWNDQVQPLLDQWGINFQVKNAYTKQEVAELVVSIEKEVIKAFITKLSQEEFRSSQYRAQASILETQLQQQLQQQKEIHESILQVRQQFSQQEEILKKMEECRNELKQVNLNSLIFLDFFRDLEGFIGEQRNKKENLEVIQTLNEIEGIMQQHSLYSIEFDTERIQNLGESIQAYIRARQLDKKVININIGDEFDEKRYISNTSGDNFMFSPSGQYAPSSLDDSMLKGSLQVKITRVANHAASKIQQAKLINLSQDKESNHSSSNQNRHLNGGCCSSHSKDFNVSLKQTSALDELKVKTAMINRLRDQLEHKLKKILLLKEELRVEREDTLKTASIKKIQESLVKMEHDYNVCVIRNNKLSLEISELKGQNEEMQREAVTLKNSLKETNKMNQELKKVVEERSGYQSLEDTVAQLSCIMVSKRNEVLTTEQRDQIRYIFGSSIVIQRLKHKIHQQEDQLEKFSSYLLQSLKLNHQYKDQLSFLWPLLRLVYQQSDLDVIKLKFEHIWKTAQAMDDYQYREIDARANFLRSLKKEIDNDNLIRSAHQTDNLSYEMTPGLTRAKALVSSSIGLDDRDSQIWQGLKSLQSEYSNKAVTTTAAKSKKPRENQSQNDFHFQKDTKLLNTQEPDEKKKMDVLLLEENLNQEMEDSLLLNDDLGAFNGLLSPFVEDQLNKKFEFGEIGNDPIRSTVQVSQVAQVFEQFQNIDKTSARDPNPEDSMKHFPQPSITPDILINQESADFTYYAQKEQNKISSTADDLKTFSVIQGVGSQEDDVSTYFRQGLKQAPKTSKKMLKEKIRALKQKNGDLVVALKELQERVWLLEEKAQARDRSISSDNKDDRLLDMRPNDPQVFKNLEI